MADKLTLRGVKRIENYVEPTAIADRIVTLKRPTTGKDQFTIKRWWTEQGNRNPKRYVNVTAFDIARSGTDIILAVVSDQDTRLTFRFDDSTTSLTFGEIHSVERIGVFSADFATLYVDYAIPRIPGVEVAANTINTIPASPRIGTLALQNVPASAFGNVATASISYTETGGTADTATYTRAWTGTNGVSFSDSSGSSTTATWPAGTSGDQTVTFTINSSQSEITNSPQAVTSSAIALTATGGINTFNTFNTATAFTASQTTGACTFSAPANGGSSDRATGTFVSDGSGNLTNVSITGAGSRYVVGETVTVEETGTSGEGSFVIVSLT